MSAIRDTSRVWRRCQLNVGLYREDTGERLLYSVNGKPVSDKLEIDILP